MDAKAGLSLHPPRCRDVDQAPAPISQLVVSCGGEAAEDRILAGICDCRHEPASQREIAGADDIDAAVAADQTPCGQPAADRLATEAERAKL